VLQKGLVALAKTLSSPAMMRAVLRTKKTKESHISLQKCCDKKDRTGGGDSHKISKETYVYIASESFTMLQERISYHSVSHRHREVS
jgi:hypothetical protein